MGVTITDVVLRDGLQDEPVLVPVADRVAIAESLIAAGVRQLEAGSRSPPPRPTSPPATPTAKTWPATCGCATTGSAI
ncbi:hypothetical protein [Saccharopolyspora taberi]|uniref:Pyruvate carboxyltransferase domain-containing protein n=1 Tax=Saccharopolyspora taberi TaxID=60895 RepID=A0ABN3VIV7_9PSEU